MAWVTSEMSGWVACSKRLAVWNGEAMLSYASLVNAHHYCEMHNIILS